MSDDLAELRDRITRIRDNHTRRNLLFKMNALESIQGAERLRAIDDFTNTADRAIESDSEEGYRTGGRVTIAIIIVVVIVILAAVGLGLYFGLTSTAKVSAALSAAKTASFSAFPPNVMQHQRAVAGYNCTRNPYLNRFGSCP